MTRNPSNSADADDSWEQLEADLFGIEVGKEHTASERMASEPALPVPDQPVVAVHKPIEEDDFGDFGAGLVEPLAVAPARKAAPPRSRTKPVAAPPAPTSVKPLPIEPAPAFKLSDLDDGPTDEELDAASESDDDESEETNATAEAENDPYWDPLANWNWQEDDRGGKPRAEAGHERSSSRGPENRGDDRQRGPRGRSSNSDRRPPRPRDSRPVSAEDRSMSAPRRPAAERERGRSDEVTANPVSDVPEVQHEDAASTAETTGARPDVKSRRQDRRRSRRHTPSATDLVAEQPESLEEAVEESWPAAPESIRSTSSESPRSRAVPARDLDDEFGDEVAENEEDLTEATGDEGPPRRRSRSRRRRRRPDRPTSAVNELAADEDLKHLEDDVEDDDLTEAPALDESADEEEGEADRPSRSRRPRRRRRGARPERPAPRPAVQARPEFDDDEESDDEDEDEPLASDADDEFDEDHDREFVEDDVPSRPARRPGRSRRSASDAPFVRHIEDDDDEDSEPEPAVSYEDVPSWEEAISYLLNPSMVEGAGAERGERAPPRTGERSSRPPRRGSRRDA